jgi:hypothetical protein
MDGWEIARKDGSWGTLSALAAVSAHLKGPLAALAGRKAALDLRAHCGSLAIMASEMPLAGVQTKRKAKNFRILPLTSCLHGRVKST